MFIVEHSILYSYTNTVVLLNKLLVKFLSRKIKYLNWKKTIKIIKVLIIRARLRKYCIDNSILFYLGEKYQNVKIVKMFWNISWKFCRKFDLLPQPLSVSVNTINSKIWIPLTPSQKFVKISFSQLFLVIIVVNFVIIWTFQILLW